MLRLITLRKILLRDEIYIFLLVISSIFAFINIKYINKTRIYNESDTEFNLVLNSFTIDGNTIKLDLKGEEKLIGYIYVDKKEQIEEFISYYNLGDTINIKGELFIPSNNTIPNTFNYKKYLYYKNIFYTINIYEYNVVKQNKNIFYKLKNYLYKRSYKSINKSYYYTFILGNKKYIEESYIDSYSSNGISHLFSISGLHVSLFASIVFFLLKLLKVKELPKYLITFSVLLFLCFITGFLPSILRATLFFFLLGLNKVFYFHIKSENILIIVFCILVLNNPYIVMDLGFQLSFTLTFFILIYSPNINSKSYIKTLFKISLMSFFVSLPIIINNFYTINPLSVIINIFFVPFVSFIVYPLSLLSFILPFLDKIFYYICLIMEKISLFISNIDIFKLSMPKIHVVIYILYFIFIFFIYKYNKRKYYIVIIILLVINYILAFTNKNTYVYFLDVGQGDSALIVTPYNKKTILIDTSGKVTYEKEAWELKNNTYSVAKDELIPFFKSIGVFKIDYLFLTHGDTDHAGEALNLINNFKVKNIYINKGDINYLESNIPNAIVINQDKFVIDNVILYSLNNIIYNEENDDSIVFYVTINNYKLLLMGDAPIKVEKDIINKYNLENIDILKVGHHGSNTSSSEIFIQSITPKECIISAGLNNKFGHPHASVIDTLNKYNCNINITFEKGSIIYKISDTSLNKTYLQPYN